MVCVISREWFNVNERLTYRLLYHLPPRFCFPDLLEGQMAVVGDLDTLLRLPQLLLPSPLGIFRRGRLAQVLGKRDEGVVIFRSEGLGTLGQGNGAEE